MTESVQALVDSAEDRFAAHGIEHASLREIMRLAGTDPGSIHYHFGGRESLARAVLDRILVPLNDRRLSLLAELSPEPSVTALMDAIVRPDIESALTLEARGRGRARLIGTIYTQPSLFVKRLVEERFAPVAALFLPRLSEALPEVPGRTIAWRVRWVVFGMIGALLSDDEELDRHEQDLLEMVVTASAGALQAGVSWR